MRKREEGITLMVLIIMIIVLLILAGIAIAALSGENGILMELLNKVKKPHKVLKERV